MAIEYRTDPEYFEYLDGAAYPKVSPRRRHALVQGRAQTIISRLAGERGFVGSEWMFRLGAADGTETAFLPDVAYVSDERLRALPVDEREEPPIAPDLAIEVRSPSHRTRYLCEKTTRYLRCGTLLMLDIDPRTRTIEAHARDGVRRYKIGERFEHPLFPWLIFEVAELFVDLDRLA